MVLRRFQFLFFFLLACFTQVFGQPWEADIQISQSTNASNDSVYFDFKIKRNSATPFLMGGYNIVFDIDTAALDTGSYKVLRQDKFGNIANSYAALNVYHLQPKVYQLVATKLSSTGTGAVLLDSYQDAGRVAFKIKKCGVTGLAYHVNAPFASMSTWNGDDVTLTFSAITPATLPVTFKISPRLPITVSETDVCPGTSVTIGTRLGFANYRLFAINPTGGISPIGSVQPTSPSFSTVVRDTATYFITFENGGSTCKDTTTSQKVTLKPAPSQPSISGTLNVCANQTFAYSLATPNTSSTYTWTLVSAGNLSTFVGTSSGVGKAQVNINFKANANTVDTVKVVESSASGCSSVVGRFPVNVTLCSFKADFTIENSDTAITSCQGAKVTFRDVSATTSGTIAKWAWHFGPGAVPDTSSLKNPPPVTYNTPGAASVKLVVTTSTGLKDSVTKSPTIKVISTLTATPQPSCGTSGCDEVNFVWPSVSGTTYYQVRYRKNKAAFSPYVNTGLSLSYKVTASMVGGLAFNENTNDTIFFQVRAIAGKCDTTASSIVFCRPSYCVIGNGCSLPIYSISAPTAGCINTTATIKANVDPPSAWPSGVKIVWDTLAFDTSRTYRVKLTKAGSQNVKFLIIDTTKTDCYSSNTITIPVTPVLTDKPDLGIQSLSCDRVTFVWKHVPGATGYNIKYDGTCITGTNNAWVPAPLGGQAEFFDLTGLSDSCRINFKVQAVGGCNVTQSDTLVTPPTCKCYIGHIASSSVTSCALDTIDLKLSDVQSPNWQVSWRVVGVTSGTPSTPKDSMYRFVPPQPNQIYHVEYTITDPTLPKGCPTSGSIYDTTGKAGTTSEWTFVKKTFCIKDAYYDFNTKGGIADYNQKHTFSGPGVIKMGSEYYFDPAKAGLGTHTVTLNACGITESHNATVVNTPCVSTVVDASKLNTPRGIYTTCDGIIYISDEGSPNAIWRFDGNPQGIPEKILVSKENSALDEGNANNVRFGSPAGIVLDETNNNVVYFVDAKNAMVKKFELDKGKLSTFSGGIPDNRPNNATTIPVRDARYTSPWGLAIHPNASSIFVFDFLYNNLKSLELAPGGVARLLAGGGAGSIPGLGKSIAFNGSDEMNIAADTAGVYIGGGKNSLESYSYSFKTDSVKFVTNTSNFRYLDGVKGTYGLKNIYGVTPPLGGWMYFSDMANYALRKVNIKTEQVETVAGSRPPVSTRNPLGQSGLPFDTRFANPGALAFSIKGYIDVLDGDRTTLAGVRRYYLPNWGTSTWNGFDSVFIANCDSDTINPEYALGTMRVISPAGKQNAVINGTIFAPKDTGTYRLGYYMKIGRCDTTFFKYVKVVAPPRSDLRGDSTCLPAATLVAKQNRDTTLRYKWFGPDSKTLAIPVSDTSRVISVTKSGKYYLQIIYGKNKCSLYDSASVLISPAASGKIVGPPPPIPNGLVYADSARICFNSGGLLLTMTEATAGQPKFKKYLWSTGETTRAIAASGSGNYVATAIDSLGCEVKAKFKLVQNPLPVICIRVRDDAGNSLPYGTYDVSTFAGSGASGQSDGIGAAASFNQPTGLALYKDTLWVTDKAGQLIRTISLKNANVQTFLGSSTDVTVKDSVPLSLARVNNPTGIALDKKGNVYVANQGDNTIYKYDRQKKVYANLAGSGVAGFHDSTGANAMFNRPAEIRIDGAGNLFVADEGNHNIRSIFPNGTVATYAGGLGTGSGAVNGKGKNARFNQPIGLGVGVSGNLFVAESFNQTIRRISLDSNVSTSAGQFSVAGFESKLYNTPIAGGNARLDRPASITSDNSGNFYFTDANNGTIRKLDVNGNVVTLAGNPAMGIYRDGRYDSSSFQHPAGIVLDPSTNDLYVADADNHVIRKVSKNKVVYICKGNRYSLQDSCRPALSSLVVWQKRNIDGSLSAPLQYSYLSSIPDTGTFIVSIRSSVGNAACTEVKDSVIVKWKTSTKKIQILTEVRGECKRDTIKLAATPGFSQYIWNETYRDFNVDTTTTNRTRLTLDFNELGSEVYRFKVIGKDPLSGCFDTSGVEVVPIIHDPRPKPIFTETFTCLGNTTIFTPVDTSSSTFEYKWDFGDTGTSDVSNKVIAQYKYPQARSYTVKMRGNGINNPSCADSIIRDVIISPGPIAQISINGVAVDSLKLCDISGAAVNLTASVTPPPSASAVYTWYELPPQDGKLDTTKKGNTTTAQPQRRSGQLSSSFGYAVFVTDTGSCVGPPDTAFVLLSTSPKFSLAASDTNICRGAPITITPYDSLGLPASDYSYRWDSAGVQVNADTNMAVLSANPLNNVTYRLTMRHKISSCTNTSSVFIRVSDFKLAPISVQPPLPCKAPDSVYIAASVLGTVVAPLQVQWLDSASLTKPSTMYPTNNLEVMAWRDTSRTYRIRVQDATGCADSAYVPVAASNRSVPIVNIIPDDTTYCVNSSVQVKVEVSNATPPLLFTWRDASTGAITSEVNAADPFAPIFTPTGSSPSYALEVTDANKCGVGRDTIKMTSANMTITLTSSQTSGLCKSSLNPNPSVTLQVTVSDFPPFTSPTHAITWTNTTTGQVAGSGYQITTTEGGMYQVQVVNTSTSCVRKDSSYVAILNTPETVTIDQVAITCNNVPLPLKALMGPPTTAKSDSIQFVWSVLGGDVFNTSSDSAVTYVPTPADTGQVIFHVVATNRCGTANDDLPVAFLQGARSKLEASPLEAFIRQEVVFINRSTNTNVLNTLQLGDGTTTNFGYGQNETFSHAYANKGSYKAKLYAMNQNGCNSIDSVTIVVTDTRRFYVPTVFSPDANHEENRYFRLFGANISATEFSLIVYNKWGHVEYSTNSLSQAMNPGWDGRGSSGEAQMGVYTYVLKGKFGDGSEFLETGTVTLLR